jgi:hypothetical protein
MSLAVYFAPTYFSPFYFPPLAHPSDDGSAAGYRDRDAFAAIVTALNNTGEFARIILGSSVDQSAVEANCVPLAVLVPSEWSEVDDVDPIVNVRQVTFTLTLVIRREDADERFHILDRLTSVVQNAIDGMDLSGGCLPTLTKLRRGHYEPRSKHPEQRLTLTGTFSYLVATPAGHDATT